MIIIIHPLAHTVADKCAVFFLCEFNFFSHFRLAVTLQYKMKCTLM